MARSTPTSRLSHLVICTCLLMPGSAFGHVILDAPNGGEVLTANSVFSIEWHVQIQHSTQNWDLWYSTTAGGPWIEIAMDLGAGDLTSGSIHTFDWLVPDVLTDEARVQVRMDNTTTDYYDASDGYFTITPEPTTLSLLIVGAFGVLRRRKIRVAR